MSKWMGLIEPDSGLICCVKVGIYGAGLCLFPTNVVMEGDFNGEPVVFFKELTSYIHFISR